jgi:hypothetical protein
MTATDTRTSALAPGMDVSYIRHTGERTRWYDTRRQTHHHVRIIDIRDDLVLVEAVDPIHHLPHDTRNADGRTIWQLEPGDRGWLPATTLAGPWETVAADTIARRAQQQRREETLARLHQAGLPTSTSGGELGCAYFDVATVAALVDERDELLDRLDQAGLLDVMTTAPAERPAALAAIDVTPVPADGLPAGAVAVPFEDLERVARLVGTLRAVSEAH